jgi:hydrogenase maturation protein HypF
VEAKIIKLPFRVKKSVLALGAQTKNTLCFAKDRSAYLSPVHPDLSLLPDFIEFEKDAKYFLRKRPKIIAYDLHPEYQSTKFALGLSQSHKVTKSQVQHHHAHIAACMVENGLSNQKVIGVAFDGTGLGLESQLWGGEFLVCDYKNFTRKAHLREVPLIGGEKAIQEPWRVAAAWLYLIYKDRFLNLKNDFVKCLDNKKWQLLKKMYLSDLHSPLASSMGRLFDGVACLVLNKSKARFEAELAIELQKLAEGCRVKASAYPFKMARTREGYLLDPAPMLRKIVLGLGKKEDAVLIAYRFHLTLAQMVVKGCLALKKEERLNRVVLTGGVFQNKLLLRLSRELLEAEGFKVFTHCHLPSSDAGLSLGQAAVACFRSS